MEDLWEPGEEKVGSIEINQDLIGTEDISGGGRIKAHLQNHILPWVK